MHEDGALLHIPFFLLGQSWHMELQSTNENPSVLVMDAIGRFLKVPAICSKLQTEHQPCSSHCSKCENIPVNKAKILLLFRWQSWQREPDDNMQGMDCISMF